MRSLKVVLPESMCAEMPMLRRVARSMSYRPKVVRSRRPPRDASSATLANHEIAKLGGPGRTRLPALARPHWPQTKPSSPSHHLRADVGRTIAAGGSDISYPISAPGKGQILLVFGKLGNPAHGP